MTTQTDTAPLSAEELARTAWSAIVKEMGNGPFGFEAEEIIAAAIRQYSEARATQAEAREAGMREQNAKLFKFLWRGLEGTQIETCDVEDLLAGLGLVEKVAAEQSGEDYEEGDIIVRLTDAGRAALSPAQPAQPAQGADPLDMPLPCDVNLPNMRFGKGVSLRTFAQAAARWKTLAAMVPLAEVAALDARSAGLLTTETEGSNG